MHAPKIWLKGTTFRTLKHQLTQAGEQWFFKVASHQPYTIVFILSALGENVAKAVEMLLDRVMLRMDTLSLPGRMLPIALPPTENGHEENGDRIKLEHASDISKCNC